MARIDGNENPEGLDGTTEDDQIFGDLGNDTIMAGAGDDTIFGGGDDDIIYGDAGNDIIYGDAGNDALFGGDGNDRFVFDTLEGDDTVDGGSTGDTTYTEAPSVGTGTDPNAAEADTVRTEADPETGGTIRTTTSYDESARTETVTVDKFDEKGGLIETTSSTNPRTFDGTTTQKATSDEIAVGKDNGDVIDAQNNASDLNVTFEGDENGLITDGKNTVQFSEIEHIITGSGADQIDASKSVTGLILDAGQGADTVTGSAGDDLISLGVVENGAAPDGDADILVLTNGFGNDSIEGFEGPTDAGGGTFTATDQIDVSGLTDGTGNPVDVDDVVVTDTIGDGTGDAVLQFPSGDSITLWGLTPDDVSSDEQLMAMGVPGVAGTLTIHDAIRTNAPFADSDTLTTAGGDLVQVDDPVSFDVASLSGIQLNDTTTIDGTAYTVTRTLEVAATVTYDEGSSSASTKALGLELTDGSGNTLNFILPIDTSGNYANITQIVTETVGDTDILPANELNSDDTVTLAPVTTALNYIVEGTSNNDSIDGSYAGDPEGDMIDAGDNLAGNNDDSVLAGAGNDTIYGGAGNDILSGEAGADIIYGDTGNDYITGGTENDLLLGGIGDDVIYGDSGNDYVSGGVDNDFLYGGSGDDIIYGDTGDDYVGLTGGNDSVSTGDGADTIVLTAAGYVDGAVVTVDGSNGGTDNDTLDLSDFTAYQNLSQTADADANSTSGSVDVQNAAGDWVTVNFSEIETLDLPSAFVAAPVDGTAGNDSMPSGYVDAQGDIIDGVDGLDDTIYGYAGNDTIVADQGNDTVWAGADNDFVDGGAGADSIYGEVGTDTLYGGAGNDVLRGGTEGDLLAGDAGNDTLYGDAGNDTLYGDGDNDSLIGGAGEDTFWDGTGNDISDGGADADTFFTQYNLGTDTIIGGETGDDNDTLISFKNVDSTLDLTAGGTAADSESGTLTTSVDSVVFSQIETIELSSGDDLVTGSDGNDVVGTGAGEDTVDGGGGNDTFDVGSDAVRDTIIFSDGDGSDTITNFDMTDNGDGTSIDQVDVSGLTSDGGTTPVTTADVTVSTNIDGDAVLTFTGGESITLVGVTFSELDTYIELESIGIPGQTANFIVEGSTGADIIDVNYTNDPGGDMVDANDHSDGSNNDSIEAYQGNDSVRAGAGDDTVTGNGGNDTLHGEAGNDELRGGQGNDSILGGTGNDLLVGGFDNDTIYGGAGNDTIEGGSDNDSIFGEGGDDVILFTDDFDLDVIDGGSTNETDGDTIDLSGLSVDTVINLTDANAETGSVTENSDFATFTEIENIVLGGGRDTIVLADGSGADAVQAFDMTDSGDGTTNDQLDVSGLTSDGGTTPVTTADVTVSFNTDGDAVLTFPGGENITLVGVTESQLDTVAELESIGIPPVGLDFIVEGTANADTIDASYIGDPEGDMIDNLDHSDSSNNDSVTAGGGNDTVYGGAGNDTILGEAGNDILFGDANNDLIFGGAGDDQIYGGAGNDTMDGGDGRDQFIISGVSGSDTIIGGETNEGNGDQLDHTTSNATSTLLSGNGLGTSTSATSDITFSEIEIFNFVGGGADVFNGAADATGIRVDSFGGNDTIITGSGNDSLFGGDGNDLLRGGEGIDFYRGHGGDDTISLNDDFGNDNIRGDETAETVGDTLDLSAVTQDLEIDLTNVDAEQGTVSNTTDTADFQEIETIVLGGGRDTLILADGSGADSVTAFDMTDSGDGTTNDQLDVTGLTSDGGTTPVTTADVLVTDTNGDGSGDAILTFPGGESITLVGVAPSQVDTPAELESIGIPGLTLDYIVEGTVGADTIDAGYLGDPEGDRVDNLDHIDSSNNDSIEAYAGQDIINAGLGNDTVWAGDDSDTVDGQAGADSIYGEGGDDLLQGSAGDDTIYGGIGNDNILGGADNDELYGDAGKDVVTGGSGNDAIEGGDDADTLYGDAGSDTILGDAGADLIFAGSEADTVEGGTENDTVYAGTGNDSVLGEDGDDTLSGEEGADTIQGGAGSDLIHGGDDGDTIFGDTGGDTIDAGSDTIYGGTGDDSIDAGLSDDIVIAGDGADTVDGGAGDDMIFGDEPLSVEYSPGAAQGSGAGGATVSNLTDFPTDTFTIEMQYNGAGMTTPGPDDPAITTTLFSYSTATSPAELVVYAVSDNEVYDLSTTLDLTDTIIETGYVTVEVNGTSYTTSIISSSIMDGSDHSLAVTFDATAQELVIFFDGAPAEAIPLIDDTPIESGGTLSFAEGAGPQGGFTGEIYDARLWGDIRTNTEINDYSSGTLEEEAGDPDLISNWVPDPFTGNFRDDVGGNGLTSSGSSVTTQPGFGDDVLSGGDGSDTLLGAGGNDTLDGDDADTLGGADYLDGGDGDDLIRGDVGNDTLYGRDGSDIMEGGDGNDWLGGGAGADSLTGGTGSDTLFGNDATDADTLEGGDDRDHIFATKNDSVDGGAGGDDFDTLHVGGVSTGGSINFVSLGPDSNGNGIDGYIDYFDSGGTFEGRLNFEEIEAFEGIICFTKGANILTETGYRPVEGLQIGDLVHTRDNGMQAIRWIGQRSVPGIGQLAPISFAPEALEGATKPLIVSPQHRMLLTGYQSELLFGETEVLVPAKYLVNGTTVREAPCAKVSYYHVMFDSHEVIYADGQATESFHAGGAGLTAVAPDAREEMFAIFPELRWNDGGHGDTARICLKAHEAQVLTQLRKAA